MPWYKKVLTQYRKETLTSVVFALVVAITTIVWAYFTGDVFEWKRINPVPEPSIPVRLLYSALVYVTLGRVLYIVGFYQVLHAFVVGGLGDWGLYHGLKKIIWVGLMAMMYFWIVPFVVEVLNVTISFFYNILNLVLYLLPSVGISIALFLVYFLMKKALEVRRLKKIP
ncbi:hypothetical protein N8083_00650 [Candidatus Pacebacteria bacterium]|nr:hypothetical protein [Candidatus Paceibacterota bacterium]